MRRREPWLRATPPHASMPLVNYLESAASRVFAGKSLRIKVLDPRRMALHKNHSKSLSFCAAKGVFVQA
jgi:hypothetical protein